MTTDTRFETTGYFRVWANKGGGMLIILRPEYGGFTQKWKLYREVPEIELDARFKLANDKRELIQEIFDKKGPAQKRLNMLTRQLEGIPDQRAKLQERAENFWLIEIS